MKFEITFKNSSFDKGWNELEILASRLNGDMKLTNGSSNDFVHDVNVEFVEIYDTVALMKTLRKMTENDIHWALWATSED